MAAKNHSTNNRPLLSPSATTMARRVGRQEKVSADLLLRSLCSGGDSGLVHWVWWRAVDWTLHRIANGEIPHEPSEYGAAFAAEFEALRKTQTAAALADYDAARGDIARLREVFRQHDVLPWSWADQKFAPVEQPAPSVTVERHMLDSSETGQDSFYDSYSCAGVEVHDDGVTGYDISGLIDHNHYTHPSENGRYTIRGSTDLNGLKRLRTALCAIVDRIERDAQP